MPSLGGDMSAGRLVEWHVKPGDHVTRGDAIATVETDKANIDVEVFETGTIERLTAEPGEKLPVGSVLAYIGGEGEAAAPAALRAAAPEAPPERVLASPLARKLARELGVDLSAVRGTGPHGAIERADVERAAARKPAEPPAAGMRRAIAAAMARSNREIPHYYLETRINLRAALDWLARVNLERGVEDRILPAALLIKAVARALTQVPELNGYWIDDGLRMQSGIHVGVAVSLRGGGLLIPAIHDADRRSVSELMAAMRDLITRARSGRLKGSELTDSTITVTNLGDLGVETVFGVIYPPQVALVGFGKIVDRAWVESGDIGVRPTVNATLAADHRATDGHRGAQFLAAVERALQEPAVL